MKFLIRTAFWLGIVALLLPAHRSPQQGSLPPVAAGEAVSAAAATASDLRAFCGRQPQACVTGSHALAYLGQIAAAGAKMAYELVAESLTKQDDAQSPRGTPKPSQNTLTPTDLATPWRAAPPRGRTGLEHPA